MKKIEIHEYLIEDRTFKGLIYHLIFKKPLTKKVILGFSRVYGKEEPKMSQGASIFNISPNLPLGLIWNAVKVEEDGSSTYYLRDFLERRLGGNITKDRLKKEVKKAKNFDEMINYFAPMVNHLDEILNKKPK